MTNKEKFLQSEQLTSDDVLLVEGVSSRGKAVKRETYPNNIIIELNADGEIESISHFVPVDGESVTTVFSHRNLQRQIRELRELAGIDYTYRLYDSRAFDKDYWSLTFVKLIRNNIYNNYQSVQATYNRKNKKLVVYRKFDNEVNALVPGITANEAYETIREDVIENGGRKSDIIMSMCYSQDFNLLLRQNDNIYRDVRLSYRFTQNGGNIIYCVDALTGKLLSTAMNRELLAKPFSIEGDEAFPDPVLQTSLADDCFSQLGYEALGGYISESPEFKERVLAFINNQNAYGFYIACHGSQTALSNNKDWWIYPNEIVGEWRFVFLDACNSLNGFAWSDAFGVFPDSVQKGFLGWNASVNGNIATLFTTVFFEDVLTTVHSSTLRDAALWSASQIAYAGLVPIQYIGDTSFTGRA